MLSILLALMLSITAIFLILLVLIQRGRGGGLAGAFGGAGGQSAFGTKAGDLFTRITIGAAAFWLVLCAVSDKLLSAPDSKLSPTLGRQPTAPGPLVPGADQGKQTGSPPAGATDSPPAGATNTATMPQGEAGPTAVGPKSDAPAETAKEPVIDAGAQSLPPGSIGPNGGLLTPQAPSPPATTEPAPAPVTPAPAAPTAPTESK
jgi:preprotein translocase subunit SecG